MKKRTIILLVLVMTICAVFVWQYISFMRLRGTLEAQTTAISEGYTTILEENVLPLRTTYTLSTTQTRLVKQMEEMSRQLTDKRLSLETRIESISRLQGALTRFSASAAGNANITADPTFAQLQTNIGEHGDIRSLLTDYNASAVVWNHSIQSELGSVVGRIDGSNRSMLPFLRFDGEQEFVPVISL